MSQESLEKIVTELDVLIRARYPLIAVNTPEEKRFHRIIRAVAQLKCHREKEKGLFVWSRTTGLRQVHGSELKGKDELLVPDTQDAVSALEYIAQQKKGLFVLCDYSPYLAPYGQEDAPLVRRLRELAWEIKGRHINVLFVERNFPDLPALEKEIKVVELPLPNEREVTAMLSVQMQSLRDGDVRVEVDERTQEQLVQALLGLTETDIENVLAKAIIAGSGLTAEALPVILDEKKSVIKGTGALTYTHAEPTDHLGGYHNLRRILTEAAATFTPAARAYGVEPMKGLLMVGLPGCGKDLTKKIASSVLGKSLLDLDFGSVMGEGGGVIGSSAMTIKRALSIATTLKGILGISEFEKAVGGLESSARTDGGETARTIAYLLNWMQEQSDVFVVGTANWSHAIREIVQIGEFVVATASIRIKGATREGVGTGSASSESGIKKAERDALRRAAFRFSVVRELFHETEAHPLSSITAYLQQFLSQDCHKLHYLMRLTTTFRFRRTPRN